VTGTQTLVDMPNTKKSDLRRARSGMVNLCPTSTGSATAIVEIYPELKGKLNVSKKLYNRRNCLCYRYLTSLVSSDKGTGGPRATDECQSHGLRL